MTTAATLLCALLGGEARPIRESAQDPPELATLRLAEGERVRLDGILDEAFWQRADVTDAFLQQEPVEGGTPSERTEVRIVHDRDALYIGVMLHDSEPHAVLGRQRQRDAGLGSDDRFMWILDTFLDGRTGYFFEINPAGLMGDGLVLGSLSGTSVNKSWDGIWEARVARGDWGWSAEIRIPFRTLNFDPAKDAWGINFQRTVRRRSEELLWSGHRRTEGLMRVVHAGRLVGLEGLSQGVGLEVKPYAVASWQAAPGRGIEGTETPADLGVDVTYSITPSLRASLTLNTDFAEAEVDQRRVNLTRFPLVFPERRDFFLEGSGVFAFAQSSGPAPYFSRRIGLIEGNPVPVAWGTRLGGQAGAQDLGFVHVRTSADVLRPGEDFTVARVKRTVRRQSSVGAIYTRRAASALDSLPSQTGHTLGFDIDLTTSQFRGNRNLQFEAFLVWHSEFAGAGGTTFGDRSARGIRLNYPNDVIRTHVSLREFGDAYDPPVGFVPRRGFRRLQPGFTYAPRPALRGVRQLEFSTTIEYLTDLRGSVETANAGFTLLGVRMNSGDNAGLSVARNFERIDAPFRIHPDVTIPAGDYTFDGWTLEISTASRRAVSGGVTLRGGEFWSGTRTQLQTDLGVSPRAGLGMTFNWERNRVDLPQGGFVTNLLRGGGGWQLNPWVALNGSLQYDDLSRVLGAFARFRWIVRPGSDLYLVYTHNLRERQPLTDGSARGGFETIDRRASTKLTWTYRF